MERFVAHVHKELRDQRAALLMVFLALPVLTLLAFWAFAEFLVEAPAPDAVGVVVPIALALYVLAVVGDLFAGEIRRGTVDFLRRQPWGLAHAFLAKTVVALAGFVGVLVWQCLLLYAAWHLWSASRPPSLDAVLDASIHAPYVFAALVLTCWTLLASTWLKQGGLAVLLAPILLGALIAPAVVWVRGNGVLLGYLVPHGVEVASWVATLVAVVALVGVAATWLSFARGRRVLRSSWSAAWRGLVLVFCCSGVAYGGAAAWIDARTTLTPRSADLVIHRVLASPSGARVWVEACLASPDGTPMTPLRTWSVDARTGAWQEVGGWNEVVDAPVPRGTWSMPGAPCSVLEPLPMLVQYRVRPGEAQAQGVWMDAETGEVLKVLPRGVVTDEVRAWREESWRRATWLRDAQGERVWFQTTGLPGLPAFSPHYCVPGAWMGFEQARAGLTPILVDVETHTPRRVSGPFASWYALSATRVLAREAKARTWFVVDLDTGERAPARNEPAFVTPLGAFTRDEVLCLEGAKERRLLFWNPRTGERREVAWRGPAPTALSALVVGRNGAGEACLLLEAPDGWSVVRLEPETGRATVLARRRPGPPQVCALLAYGSAYGIEKGKQIVRYGPEPDAVEVVFPRITGP